MEGFIELCIGYSDIERQRGGVERSTRSLKQSPRCHCDPLALHIFTRQPTLQRCHVYTIPMSTKTVRGSNNLLAFPAAGLGDITPILLAIGQRSVSRQSTIQRKVVCSIHTSGTHPDTRLFSLVVERSLRMKTSFFILATECTQ